MKKYRCKKLCYWGPQVGTESLIQPDTIIFANGNEPNLEEFFEAVDAPEAPAEPKPVAGGRGRKKAAAEEEL